MVNLTWFDNEKNVYRVSTEQHENMKSGNHFASVVCYSTVLLEHVKVHLSPQPRKCNRFARVLWLQL